MKRLPSAFPANGGSAGGSLFVNYGYINCRLPGKGYFAPAFLKGLWTWSGSVLLVDLDEERHEQTDGGQQGADDERNMGTGEQSMSNVRSRIELRGG